MIFIFLCDDDKRRSSYALHVDMYREIKYKPSLCKVLCIIVSFFLASRSYYAYA
jgi:hypothetical protein